MQIDSTEFRYFIKTSTTLCQKASTVHKVTATEQTESLTSYLSTKNGIAKRPRRIYNPPIASSLSPFDYRLIDVWYKENNWSEGIEMETNDDNWPDRFTHQSRKTAITKCPLRIFSPPIASSLSSFDSGLIEVWWRQKKWLEVIENQESDGDRTIKNTYLSWKTALRLESPDLHWSKHTTAILIEFWIDWCMITAKQVVRRLWKSRKWWWQNINNHFTFQK